MQPVRPSSRQPPQSVYQPVSQSHCPSITTASPSVIPGCPSSEQSVHPPVPLSLTCQSAIKPVSPVKSPSERLSLSNCLYTILPRPSVCPTSSDHTSTIYTSLSDHLPLSHHLYDTPTSPSDHLSPSHRLYNTPTHPSACPSPPNCLTTTTTHPPVCPSSPMIHSTQDSIDSLAVVNGEQSHMIHHTQDSSQSQAAVNGEHSRKAKKVHRAFTNYNLLLHALYASSIYLRDLRHVAPPKSGEDAHVTHGKCDFGEATLNNLSLGFSYVLPRLWDPGGVRSSPNVPRGRFRALAPSRYPYTPRTSYLVNLPNLQ